MFIKHIELPASANKLVHQTEAALNLAPPFYKERLATRSDDFICAGPNTPYDKLYSYHEVFKNNGEIIIPLDIDGLDLFNCRPVDCKDILTNAIRSILGPSIIPRYTDVRFKPGGKFSFHGQLSNFICGRMDFLKFANQINDFIRLRTDLSTEQKETLLDIHIYKSKTASLRAPWSGKSSYIEELQKYTAYNPTFDYSGLVNIPGNCCFNTDELEKHLHKMRITADLPLSEHRTDLLNELLHIFTSQYAPNYTKLETTKCYNGKAIQIITRDAIFEKPGIKSVPMTLEDCIDLRDRFNKAGSSTAFITNNKKILNSHWDKANQYRGPGEKTIQQKWNMENIRRNYENAKITDNNFIKRLNERINNWDTPTSGFIDFMNTFRTIGRYISLVEGFSVDHNSTWLSHVLTDQFYIRIPMSIYQECPKNREIHSDLEELVCGIIADAYKIPINAIKFVYRNSRTFICEIHLSIIPCHVGCCKLAKTHKSFKQYSVTFRLEVGEILVSRMHPTQSGCRVVQSIDQEFKTMLTPYFIDDTDDFFTEEKTIQGISENLDEISNELVAIPEKVIVLCGNTGAGKTTAVLNDIIKRNLKALIICDKQVQCRALQNKIAALGDVCVYGYWASSDKLPKDIFINPDNPYIVITTVFSATKIHHELRYFDCVMIDEWNSIQETLIGNFGNVTNKYVGTQELLQYIINANRVYITEPFILREIMQHQLVGLFDDNYVFYKLARKGFIPTIHQHSIYDLKIHLTGLISNKISAHIVCSDKILAVNIHHWLINTWPDIMVQLIVGDSIDKTIDESNQIIISTMVIAHAIDINHYKFSQAILIRSSGAVSITNLMNGAMRIRHEFDLHVFDTYIPPSKRKKTLAARLLEISNASSKITHIKNHVCQTLSPNLTNPVPVLQMLSVVNAFANYFQQYVPCLTTKDFVQLVYNIELEKQPIEISMRAMDIIDTILFEDTDLVPIVTRTKTLCSHLNHFCEVREAGNAPDQYIKKEFMQLISTLQLIYPHRQLALLPYSELKVVLYESLAKVYIKIRNIQSQPTDERNIKYANFVYQHGFEYNCKVVAPLGKTSDHHWAIHINNQTLMLQGVLQKDFTNLQKNGHHILTETQEKRLANELGVEFNTSILSKVLSNRFRGSHLTVLKDHKNIKIVNWATITSNLPLLRKLIC